MALETRACWWSLDGKWRGGKLHAWSIDSERVNGDIVEFPVGIVEDEKDGRVRAVPVGRICFVSIPPT